MDQDGSVRIQVEAARALARWKANFAEQVAVKAKELARSGDPPGLVTLDHYRRAAQVAAQELATALHDPDSNHGRQEAA